MNLQEISKGGINDGTCTFTSTPSPCCFSLFLRRPTDSLMHTGVHGPMQFMHLTFEKWRLPPPCAPSHRKQHLIEEKRRWESQPRTSEWVRTGNIWRFSLAEIICLLHLIYCGAAALSCFLASSLPRLSMLTLGGVSSLLWATLV